jgi:hypothetical protein
MSEAVAVEGRERCPDCGAAGVGGRSGCQGRFDEIAARAYGDLGFAAVQALAFDTYCMQHVARYCHSAKSYAAHLTRLCCGMEYGGDPVVYAAIQRWLNGSANIEKPALLACLGRMTVADLRAGDPAEHARQVQAWAGDVWKAYTPQHELARAWIRLALRGAQKQ